MHRQLGFNGAFTCCTHSCKLVIRKAMNNFTFRSAFSYVYKNNKPSCVSLHNRGVFNASLTNQSDSTEKVTVEIREHHHLYWIGLFSALLFVWPETADALSLDVLKDVFKSKPLSLVHPFVMLGVLGTSLYTFYLGYQSRRIREADSETRKELVKGRYGQRHYQTSAVLLAVLTFFTFEGMANTFTRTGKLFPGPHLYAGLGAVTVMSIMASLAPFMQQGKTSARNVHFILAFVAVSLIGSQLQSGYHILARLLGWE